MNSKYFGNALDLFKFDLLTYLSKECSEGIYYVPMITEPQPKEHDPKYLTYEIGSGNKLLYEFLQPRFKNKKNANINDIGEYFKKIKVNFNIAPNNIINSHTHKFFTDEIRGDYFNQVIDNYKTVKHRALLYCDPDVGADVGIIRRFRSKRDMYIKMSDLLAIRDHLKTGDYIGYFQHLGNSNYPVKKRIQDIKDTFGKWSLMVGYSRIQASIVLLFDNKRDYEDKRKKIKLYFKQYEFLDHKDKIILE